MHAVKYNNQSKGRVGSKSTVSDRNKNSLYRELALSRNSKQGKTKMKSVRVVNQFQFLIQPPTDRQELITLATTKKSTREKSF